MIRRAAAAWRGAHTDAAGGYCTPSFSPPPTKWREHRISRSEESAEEGRSALAEAGSEKETGIAVEAAAATAVTATAAAAATAAVRMTHVGRGRDMPATHNAGDSSRTPQALSHLFCSWRFVGFLPRDGKTTVVRARHGVARLVSSRLVSALCVALKLLKWKRVCHPHYVRLSLFRLLSPLHAPFLVPSFFSPFSPLSAPSLSAYQLSIYPVAASRSL